MSHPVSSTRPAVLHITTSRDGLGPGELAVQPEAGCVFRPDDVGVRGLPPSAYADS